MNPIEAAVLERLQSGGWLAQKDFNLPYSRHQILRVLKRLRDQARIEYCNPRWRLIPPEQPIRVEKSRVLRVGPAEPESVS